MRREPAIPRAMRRFYNVVIIIYKMYGCEISGEREFRPLEALWMP
jgi:hypothetical protein